MFCYPAIDEPYGGLPLSGNICPIVLRCSDQQLDSSMPLHLYLVQMEVQQYLASQDHFSLAHNKFIKAL